MYIIGKSILHIFSEAKRFIMKALALKRSADSNRVDIRGAAKLAVITVITSAPLESLNFGRRRERHLKKALDIAR